jgi:Xaa-Pro aminopeptidase
MRLPDTATLAARQLRIREQFDILDIDALVVTSFPNIRYLSNHAGSAGILVLTRDGAHLVVDFRYVSAVAALQESAGACPGLRVWPVPASYEEALLSCLSELGVARVGLEAANVTLARYEWLVATVASRSLTIAFRSTTGLVERARMVKDATEIAILRAAAERLDGVVDAAFKAVRRGVSERHVAVRIEAAMREAGYERPAFDTIVASGPNAALPHHRAGDRTLSEGDLIVLDFGGVLDGYCSDITRTVSVGAVSPRARELYDAVHAAQRAAVAVVRPGVLTTAVDGAARNVLDERGLGPNFGHGTGHGLGLEVHEDPRVGKPRADVEPVTLEPGMVFTIEPGAYVAGFGGVRIEDDVLVTADGCEVLTRPGRELLSL